MGNASRLPGRAEHRRLWQEGAACRELGPRLFFQPTAEQGPDRERRDEAAKEVCALCPVQRDCLRHVLRAGEPLGVWGGLDERERRRLRAAQAESPALPSTG
ncbi:WhiB family transcriptional regulator [Streptomyces sp. ISL-43]|uniref:WhiB family transcriptional regulator n=1 Tax=Streptomyces sp. ISL-43 TaxID=2819183 RepID=UPI001BECB911|nr:WhiB family transcriptional regulator [Streptomyces sp. ISL-43]MBT2449784.1 WhiB family transcriptional regulator [Streptomyces sp. ISL-43]